MSLHDIHHYFTVKRLISPNDDEDTTAQVSQIIDTQGYDGLEIVLATGTIADADVTFALLFEEGDISTLSDNATVAAGSILGTKPTIKFDSDDSVFKFGYIGNKRYVRLTVTPSGNSDVALLSGVAILGLPHAIPAA